MIKKIIKVIGIILFLTIIAAAAIPYFFKNRIVEAVKTEINNSINAKVDFEDVSLSLFKSFPDFNFSLNKLSVIGINEFEGHELLEADNIEFSLDLMSVINNDKPIKINEISFQKPEINIKVLKNGQANYNIAKQTDISNEELETSNLNFLIQLQEYGVTDGSFIYEDQLSDSYIEIKGLDHEGKGKFTQDVFDLHTATNIGSITAKSSGITYLNKTKGNIDLTLNADITNSKYTIKENSINLNALKLNTSGYVQMIDDKIKMDIKYDAPNNNFKNLLSMIPSAYTADFQDVEANGNLVLDGFVKGEYEISNGALPSFLINLKVENGDFKYPDLPLGIKGINTITKISSPSSDLNKMVVDVSEFKMELGNNPFEAKMKLSNLLTDPNIDSKINGTINLDELSKAFPFEDIKKISGIITSNIEAKTSMSAIDAQRFEDIDMSGNLEIVNMDYQSKDLPQIQIANMQMKFTPKHVKLESFNAQLGKSDISAVGTIDNILAYFTPEKTMTGQMKIRSNFFDSNEWITTDEEANLPNGVSAEVIEEEALFDRFNFTVDGEIKRLLYDVYDLRDSKLVGQLTSNESIINLFQTKIGESDFKMNGKITNVFNYVFENEILKGNINLSSDYINANEFMVEEVDPQAVNMEVIPVPERMDLNLNADIQEVLYTNIPLRNIKGKIMVANQVATISNCNAKTLGGNVIMNGTYDTKDIQEPKFDMDYKVNSLNYQDAFEKLNTFKTLAPIGEYIEGKFNTTLKISGILGKDMLPDLSTLTADGFLQTIEGSLKNFKPVEDFANKLNIDFLKSVNLKNTKNWFELNNGKVIIKDFDYKTKGIEMVIGGTHGLDSEMLYSIKAKIPRKILQQNSIGQVADKGLNLLQSQATKLGINIDQSEFVNVNALISGTMTKPNVKLNLIGSDGEAASIDKIVDDIKDKAVDKVSEIIEDKTGVDIKNIEAEVKEVKEDLSAKADAEVKILMKKTEENINKIRKEAQKRANQTKAEAKKLSVKTKSEGYKQADAIIEKAGGNIFKKKAAEIAANKLKKEADKKSEQIITKGDDTAKTIIDKADKQAEKLQTTADSQANMIRDKYK